MDDDGSKSLDKNEFKKAMREMTIQLQDSEFEALFALFDQDKSGTISFDELLVAIRGPVNEKRRTLINMAFDVLDTDGSGTIDGEEIASKYDASKHPDAEEFQIHFFVVWQYVPFSSDKQKDRHLKLVSSN